MHECCTKRLRMGTVRMKKDKETYEGCKQKSEYAKKYGGDERKEIPTA